MLRGEEDRGSLDVLLSAAAHAAARRAARSWPRCGRRCSRWACSSGCWRTPAARRSRRDFALGDALLFGLNLALICAVFGGLALLISQFTQERGPAAGWTAGLLLVFIVLDMVHRVDPDTEWISRLSPIYYYNLSKPLIPSYGTNVGAMLVLLALALVLSGAAIWLFVRRDVGDVVPLPRWLRLPARPPRRAGAARRTTGRCARSTRAAWA